MYGEAEGNGMFDGTYDVIVLGVGGMGSAACLELARRGRRVLGLEQFGFVHDHGSSHGQTRVIRKAYYEHPAYVPLLRRAYERWYDLEQLCGWRLFTECGCLTLGRPDSELILGVQASAAHHNLPVERLTALELRRRIPAFQFDDTFVGLLERDAGFLAVEECVRACVEQARRFGADLRENEPVTEWEARAAGVVVQTAGHRYAAERLVITAGPWAGRLLAGHGAALTLMRQVLLWFGTADDRLFRRDVFPCHVTELDTGVFYGFPVIDGYGAKVARHYGAPELRDPSEVDRAPTAHDEEAVRPFLRAHLPAVNGPLRRAVVCTYTLTPDRHFILDVHPEHPNVSVAAGFSGHGFKFASVVGEIMADLAEKGRTDLPIEMFRFDRFRRGKG
jgi:sarcosine oxidase